MGSGFFLKTLLAKKYALPTQVINALVDFFINFSEGNRGMGEMGDMEDEDEEQVDDGST